MAATTILMTGFPGFIGRNVLATLLADPRPERRIARAYLLVQEKFLDAAAAQAGTIRAAYPDADLRLVVGDITAPGLGLSEEDARAVRAEAAVVYHLAALYDLTTPREIAYRINVEGTRNVIDLCRTLARLDRLVYFSTYAVAGRRSGRVREDELCDSRFKNHYESTKYEAEVLVRGAMPEVPTVIVRPAIVVGDSRTGATDKFDGPYFLLRFLWRMAKSGLPFDRLPIPSPYAGRGTLNLVPIDYIARASAELAFVPEALGKTFHLCDPNPWTAHEMLRRACVAYGMREPVGHIPTPLTRLVFRSDKVRRYFQIPGELIDYTSWTAIIDDTNARTILGARGIVAPSIETFFPAMLDYVKSRPDTPSSAKF